MNEIIGIIMIAIIALPVKIWIDKKRYIKQLDKREGLSLSSNEIYDVCKSYIKDGERHLKEYTNGKKIYTIWDPSTKKPNASAGLPFLIVFTGDWSFLADNSEASKAYLYSTIGHELAHKDHEPSYSCSNRTCNLKNHVREVRADFCGIAFAMKYFKDRDFIIKSKFKYRTNIDDKEKKTDHPSNTLRKYCLENHKEFNKVVIEDIVKAKEYCDLRSKEYIDDLEQKCYKGRFFYKGSF